MPSKVSAELDSLLPQQDLVLLDEWLAVTQESRLYQVTWGLQVVEFRWLDRKNVDFFFFPKYNPEISLWGVLRSKSFYYTRYEFGSSPAPLDPDMLTIRAMAHLLGMG